MSIPYGNTSYINTVKVTLLACRGSIAQVWDGCFTYSLGLLLHGEAEEPNSGGYPLTWFLLPYYPFTIPSSQAFLEQIRQNCQLIYYTL